MSHLEDFNPSLLRHTYSFSKEQQLVSTIALLVLGYYAILFFDIWPSTFKRSFYEVTIHAVPASFVYALQYVMMRLGRLSDNEVLFRREDFGDPKRKEEALHRLFGHTSIPTVLNRARTLSGFDKLLPHSGELGPPGLGNWDNSCYQNSVLQGLASLPAFQAYIHRSSLLCQKTNVHGGTTLALTQFVDQLAESRCQRSTIWTPGILKSMDSWQQQDAQEYFSRVSDAIEKEALEYMKVLQRRAIPGLDCLQSDGKPFSTKHLQDYDQPILRKQLQEIVHNPMDGMQAQTLRCQTCQYSEGIAYTHFNCLTLNLGLGGECDLRNLLDAYTEPELIEGVECDECTKHAQSTPDSEETTLPYNEEPKSENKPKRKKPVLRMKAKQITLGRLPRDLVIHINRSIFDDYGNQKKNTSFVHVPERLDILGDWCAPVDAQEDSLQAIYELRCMVTHQGRHDNGHYVAFGKRDKYWYCFNDEIVTKTTVENVLSRGTAFMLFYEAVDHIESTTSDSAESGNPEGIMITDGRSATTSGSESEGVEEPVTQIPQFVLPAMRTASGSAMHLESDGHTAPNIVPAI